jgi:hypothetical protein
VCHTIHFHLHTLWCERQENIVSSLNKMMITVQMDLTDAAQMIKFMNIHDL